MNQDTIAVIDLGSARVTDLARAIRAHGVYSELHPHDLTPAQVAAIPNLRGFILASGPRRDVPASSSLALQPAWCLPRQRTRRTLTPAAPGHT